MDLPLTAIVNQRLATDHNNLSIKWLAARQLLEIISNAAVIQRQPVQLLVAIEKHDMMGSSVPLTGRPIT